MVLIHRMSYAVQQSLLQTESRGTAFRLSSPNLDVMLEVVLTIESARHLGRRIQP